MRGLSRLALAALCLLPDVTHAFCGFFVAKADTRLFNQASRVVIVRDGDRTVLTMGNDYQGALAEFAMVIPVPTVLQKGQIHVANAALLDHLDAFTAPRLVEYHDDDPCRAMERMYSEAVQSSGPAGRGMTREKKRAKDLGVTIEASYTVGEYDIVILSAKESDGLETWLRQEGYRLPEGAAPVLGSYLRQGTKFFVARVNLGEQAKLGFQQLRPLQVAFESPKFMLPIRLGMVNAKGTQELFAFVINRTGRVETTNYRTVKLPTGAEVPPYVKRVFQDFYRDLFTTAHQREDGRAVFLEYAWDMGWCDPCAADPLSARELRELGAFWIDAPEGASSGSGPRARRAPPMMGGGGAQDAFVTRLHVRYDAAHFPDDLFFQETRDRENFQGRYVLRHPWHGSADACPAAAQYIDALAQRQTQENQTLAQLTGWDLADIRARRGPGAKPAPPQDAPRDDPQAPAQDPPRPPAPQSWWERLWD